VNGVTRESPYGRISGRGPLRLLVASLTLLVSATVHAADVRIVTP
jgi:hypothetical protein